MMKDWQFIILFILGLIILGCLIYGCSFYLKEGLETKVPEGGENVAKEVCAGYDDEESCRMSTQCMWEDDKCIPNPADIKPTMTQLEATEYAT